MNQIAGPVSHRTDLSLSQSSRSIARVALLFFPLVGLFIGLRVRGMTDYSLWGGEIFTLRGAQQSWADMIAYVIADVVHPPLFYVLLKLWIGLGGESLLWLKLLPVLTAILSLLPLLLLCRALGLGSRESALALWLVGLNGYLIHYAQEVRMYTPFMFLALCSYWLFVRTLKAERSETRWLVALTIVNLLLLYTHYYGWLVVGLEWLYLLYRKRQAIIGFSLSVLLLLLCFVPWLYAVTQAAIAKGGLASNLDWLPLPGARYFIDLYLTFNGPLSFPGSAVTGLLLFGMPVVVWGVRWLAGQARAKADALVLEWLGLLAFVPPVLLLIASRIAEHNFWIDRYFIFIAVPYLILVAAAAFRLQPLWLRYLVVTLLAAWSLVAGPIDGASNRIAWESPQLGSRLPWDQIAATLARETASGEAVVIYTIPVWSRGMRTGGWTIRSSLSYYLEPYRDRRFEFRYARNPGTLATTVEESRFWVASFKVPHLRRRPIPTVLGEAGYQVGPPVRAGGPGRSFVLFPVSRRTMQ